MFETCWFKNMCIRLYIVFVPKLKVWTTKTTKINNKLSWNQPAETVMNNNLYYLKRKNKY